MSAPASGLFTRREQLLLGLGAVLLVALAAAAALRWEIVENRRSFALQSHSISLQVSRRLAEGETLMGAFHGLHHSADELMAARFPSIVERFRAAHPQVRWVAFAERTERGAEHAFEERMQRQGFMGMRVHAFDDANETTQPDGSGHALRLPIYQLEPLTPIHARFLGVDVASRSEWRKAIDDAITTASVRAVPTYAPAQGLDGVLLLRATYLGNTEPDNALERRAQLQGLLMLFIDADELIANLVTTMADTQVRLPMREATAQEALARGPGVDAWSARMTTVRPESAANILLPLQISAPMPSAWRSVFGAIALAALVALSFLHALRQRRLARHEEHRAFVQAQLAEITLHAIGEAVIRLDEGGRIRYLNPVAEVLSGHDGDWAKGRLLEDVLQLRANGPVTAQTIERLADEHTDVYLLSPVGEERAMACTLSSLSDVSGATPGRVLVMRDVSREHELAQELAYQAIHDPLTDLPNRRAFTRQLARAVEQAREGRAIHSLFYIDLDQFKVVNDTCGHDAGDRMLRQIAGLLSGEVRDEDVLARLGGDEFGVLLHDCSVEMAMTIANRLCDVVSSFRFVAGGRVFSLGASIGVVELGKLCATVDDVQRAADLACYAAKDSGRNRVHLFREEDAVINRNHEEMQWHSEIRSALEEDRLVLHAQPIRSIRAGGANQPMHEVLLRMITSNGELVPPMAFLPAAERYGLMGDVDRAVIEKAFQHAADTEACGHSLAINLSGQSFTDPDLGKFILDAASRVGVEPHRICFEVTETAAISNIVEAGRLMQSLKNSGFRFALDDFGAGLSSFGYLKHLPVDFIKIDGQFVLGIESDHVAQTMVMSIVNVAQALGINTVAEKVESEAVLVCLRGLGVDYVQGFHIGRPRQLQRAGELARIA